MTGEGVATSALDPGTRGTKARVLCETQEHEVILSLEEVEPTMCRSQI